MTFEELERALTGLQIEQNRIMKLYYQNLETKDYNKASELFNTLVELQNLINEYKRFIARKNGWGFVNKFGKMVYTKESLEYWDQLYDEIFPKKENEPVKKLK